MLSLSHATFSGFTVALALSTANPAAIALGAIAGLLPDLDTPNSWPGRLLRPVSVLVGRWGHRQVTHSLLGSAIASLIFLPLLLVGGIWYWAATIGYLSGWLLDAASKTGVPAFWPSPKRLVFPYDPEFRLKTGSTTERLFQVVLILLLGAMFHLNSGGGALASFSNWLGSSQGAVQTYSRYANEREIWAAVDGSHKITQQPIKERMKVVGLASESDLILEDGQGRRYRAGTGADSNIRTHSIRLELGTAIATSIIPVQIPEEQPLGKLLAVLGETDYVTGELQTTDGPLLSSQRDPRFYPALTVSHSGGEAVLHLRLATRADLQNLPDIWIQGSVTVRRIE